MSIAVMTYVWKHSTHKGSELLTLLAIADYAHDDGTNAYPSIAELSAKTRMTERSMQLILKKLELSKELQIDPKGGPHGRYLFEIPMEGTKRFRGEKISPEKISGVKRFRGEKSGNSGVKNPVKNAAPSSSPLSDSPLFISPVPDPSFEPSEGSAVPPPIAAQGKKTAVHPQGTRRCPPDYVPSAAVRDWGASKYPGINVDDALDAMRDWEFKDAKRDWDATLRTWIRNEAKRAPQTGAAARNGTSPLSAKGQRSAAAMHRILERSQANAGHRPAGLFDRPEHDG
jgi:hypothetical protein